MLELPNEVISLVMHYAGLKASTKLSATCTSLRRLLQLQHVLQDPIVIGHLVLRLYDDLMKGSVLDGNVLHMGITHDRYKELRDQISYVNSLGAAFYHNGLESATLRTAALGYMEVKGADTRDYAYGSAIVNACHSMRRTGDRIHWYQNEGCLIAPPSSLTMVDRLRTLLQNDGRSDAVDSFLVLRPLGSFLLPEQ